MNDITIIKQLATHFNQKQTIHSSQIVNKLCFDKQEPMILLQLLLVKRNNLLQSHHKPQGSLFILLEELTSIVANKVLFEPPLNLVAAFDRLSFHEQCQKSSNQMWKNLSDKVFGLYTNKDLTKYPYSESIAFSLERDHCIQKLEQDSQSCRKVLKVMYQKCKNKVQKEFFQILLCMKKELFDQNYCFEPWRKLWTVLYIWTVQLLENATVDYKKYQSMIQESIGNIKQNGNKIDRIFCDLFSSSISQSSKNTNFLHKAAQDYLSLQKYILKQSFSTIDEICITLVLKDCACLDKMSGIVEQCNSRLSQLQFDIVQESHLSERQKVLAISYFLTGQDLYDYLKKFRLPFWDYGLSEQVSSEIALTYLNETRQGDPTNSISWQKVIEELSPQTLRNRILVNPSLWNYSFWSSSFLHLCEHPSQIFIQKVSSALEQDNKNQIKKDLHKFYEQWWYFLQSAKIENKTTQKNYLQQLMTFDFNLSDRFKKICKFPQNIDKVFLNICIKHIQLLQEDQFPDDSNFDFAFQPSFAQNIINFSASSWDDRFDSYWQLWTSLLLKNDRFMKGIIEIEPEREDITVEGESPN